MRISRIAAIGAGLVIGSPLCAGMTLVEKVEVPKEVIGKMEAVEADLVREETGEITQAKVQEILAALDRLIDEIDPPYAFLPPPKPPCQEPGVTVCPGPNGPPGQRPTSPLQNSQNVERGGEGLLSPFHGEEKYDWGKRVPIESEKAAVARAREDRMPREYEMYLTEYFRGLMVFASRD